MRRVLSVMTGLQVRFSLRTVLRRVLDAHRITGFYLRRIRGDVGPTPPSVVASTQIVSAEAVIGQLYQGVDRQGGILGPQSP